MKRIIPSLLVITTLSAPASENAIERWNAEFLSAVRRQAMPPCLASRNLAILHLGVWRAVEDVPQEDVEAAAAAAAHRICTALFAGDRAGFDELFGRLSVVSPSVLEASRAIADRCLEERENDGSTVTIHYHPKLAAGIWQRTTRNRRPELPHWSRVEPFVLTSAAEFRPPPPPMPDSAGYAEMLAEVRSLGGKHSKERTRDQEEAARFWSDFSYTSSPPGRWNEIACRALKGKGWSVRGKARLFAMLNVAMADAGIAAWDCKYHYRFWRPVSAIREDMDDHNPETRPDADWRSLLPAPSHPEYVSGHSTFSGAAARVLAKLLGKPEQPITVTCRDMPDVTRRFSSFEEIAIEVGRSRIYGGIHFAPADVEGRKLGRRAAEKVLDALYN